VIPEAEPLPLDNTLPLLLAEQIQTGRVSKPFIGDWLSSDRPPLQAGFILSQYPYLPRPRDLGYTVLAVVLQSLWIFALWMFLVAFDIPPPAITLVIAVTLFSGFIFVNTFFVWPKLLAAAYMLAFSVAFLAEKVTVLFKASIFLCAIAGALLAFGLLAHGGSAFALIGLFSTSMLLRRRLPLRSLAVIATTCFVLYLPWICYQKFYDPPDDRLLKWHLAGVINPDARSFTKTIRAAYGGLTVRKWLTGREKNALMVFDQGRRILPGFADAAAFVAAERSQYYDAHYLAPQTGNVPSVPSKSGFARFGTVRSDHWHLEEKSNSDLGGFFCKLPLRNLHSDSLVPANVYTCKYRNSPRNLCCRSAGVCRVCPGALDSISMACSRGRRSSDRLELTSLWFLHEQLSNAGDID
jgi:hypothetical protein